MPAHETKHIGAKGVISLVTGLRPCREERLDRYEFPQLTKRGNIPPPTVSPLPDLPLPAGAKTPLRLSTPASDMTGNSQDRRNHPALNGTILWQSKRSLP